MKRRTFIISSAALIISAPFASYLWFSEDKLSMLKKPETLLSICNDEELFKIGRRYISLHPLENSKDILMDKLLTSTNNIKKSNLESTLNYMLKRIENDFKNKEYINIEGWVISITEARQCALLAITS